QAFIDAVVAKANRRNAKTIESERKFLQPLPKRRSIDYSEQRAVVSSSSTIAVRRVTYTVPSRLQGEVLNVRIYDDRLVCHLGSHYVVTLPRLQLPNNRKRGRQVDYRHVVHSLVKKPQAFRYSQLREDLLPDANYLFIWQSIDKTMAPQEACKFIVNLLYLAATYHCEKALGERVVATLKEGQTLSLAYFQKLFCKRPAHLELEVEIIHPSLEQYNQLIPQERCYHV
ncbi:MAG: IS21 family transposase, partial [Alphaproteobacteria bacterium]